MIAPSSPPKRKVPPILLVAGGLFLLAVVLEVLRLFVFSTPLENKGLPQGDRDGSVFEELKEFYPTFKAPSIELVYNNVQPFSHNLIQGSASAPVVLTVFTDVDCKSCRLEVRNVRRMLAPYAKDMRFVYKFVPAVKREMQGGIFSWMAKNGGVGDAFLNKLFARIDTIDAGEYFELLEDLGLPLESQRYMMSAQMDEILRDLRKDISQAEKVGVAGKDVPVFYLNGYRLGQNYLPLTGLETYVRRLRARESILPN